VNFTNFLTFRCQSHGANLYSDKIHSARCDGNEAQRCASLEQPSAQPVLPRPGQAGFNRRK
jgi:hypothetical protein